MGYSFQLTFIGGEIKLGNQHKVSPAYWAFITNQIRGVDILKHIISFKPYSNTS